MTIHSRGMRLRYDGEGSAGAGGEAGGDGGGPAIGGSGSGTLLGGGNGGTGSGAAAGTPVNDFKLPDGWDYRTALPAELKESPSAKKYGSLADLVRGFDNAQQLIGKPTDRLVEIPPNADATVRRGVLERLGLPKNLPDYKVNPVKGAEKFFDVEHPNMKTLVGKAHELGIMPDQFQGLLEAFGGLTVANAKAMQEAEVKRTADSVAAIKEQWGEAFDGKVAAANFAIDKLGGDKAGADKLRDALNSRGLGTDAVVLDALAKVGEMFGESTSGGDKPNFGDGMTPDSAKSEGMRLLQEALNEKDQFKRKALNEKAQEYFARADKRKG